METLNDENYLVIDEFIWVTNEVGSIADYMFVEAQGIKIGEVDKISTIMGN